MGSVPFQIVPCSSLYFFSRFSVPFQCLVNTNYRVLIYCTCHFQYSSLFFVYFGFLCLQVSSVSNFRPGQLLRLTCSIVLWGGRKIANKYHWPVWGVLTVSGPHWVCPGSWHVCFPSLHCSGSRLFCRELSKAGRGFCALPSSHLLRFRFSGIPQRHRLG